MCSSDLFFPGRYAVEVMQQCAQGDGLGPVWFSGLAVVLTGLGAGVTGAKLFRWDAHQRFLTGNKKAWLLATVGVWILIGVGAEAKRMTTKVPGRPSLKKISAPVEPAPPPQSSAPVPPTPTPTAPAPQVEVKAEPVVAPPPPVVVTTPAPVETAPAPPAPTPAILPAAVPPVAAAKTETPPANPAPAPVAAEPWKAYTKVDFARLDIANVPPDNGNVTPIAAANDEPDMSQRADLAQIESALPKWGPAQVTDRVQMVRNILYIAGTLDESQTNTERFVPYLVMNYLQTRIPTEELTQILCWIANHPNDGDASAAFRIQELGVFANVDEQDIPEIRRRNQWYATKFVWWLLGW